MQFQKKTRAGLYSNLIRTLLKIAFFFIIIFLLIILIDRINFPYPNKKIEKVIPNENFKVLK